jgi:hypothetical protein
MREAQQTASRLVFDSTDADGCYTLVFNEPSSVPGFINIPDQIALGSTPQISWEASTDPEGCAVTYKLKRKFNDESFMEIYSGPNLSFTDADVPSGKTTVQYRVKATDAAAVESAYATSAA